MVERYVSIQTLSPAYRDNHECRQGIEKAADIISKFEHPNIVPIIDFGNHDGIPIYCHAMDEWRLSQRLLAAQGLHKRTLSSDKITDIVRQIGDALEYLYSQDQVHGDPSTNSTVRYRC
jgi:serine/threonine protein kinase